MMTEPDRKPPCFNALMYCEELLNMSESYKAQSLDWEI